MGWKQVTENWGKTQKVCTSGHNSGRAARRATCMDAGWASSTVTAGSCHLHRPPLAYPQNLSFPPATCHLPFTSTWCEVQLPYQLLPPSLACICHLQFASAICNLNLTCATVNNRWQHTPGRPHASAINGSHLIPAIYTCHLKTFTEQGLTGVSSISDSQLCPSMPKYALVYRPRG